MPKVQLKPFPFTTSPQRSIKQSCEICTLNFNNLTLRQHICKRCFRSICDDCSPYKVRSYRADLQHRLHRMCKICHKQSQILNKYIENNKLTWSQDSDMCSLWLKQLGYQNRGRGSYRMTTRKQISLNNDIDQYQVDINQLWGSLNFSFRQFIGITIDKSKKQYKQILQQITGCLTEIMQTMVNHKMQPQHIIYVIMFFLAHSSPYNAVLFTKSLIQILSCQQPSIQNITYYLQLMHCTQIQCYKLQSFLENNLETITKTITINYFTTQISIQILSAIISKKYYQELEKGIAYVLNLRKQFITKNANKPQLVIIDILKNTEGLGNSYRKSMRNIQQSMLLSNNTNTNISGSITGGGLNKSYLDTTQVHYDRSQNRSCQGNNIVVINNSKYTIQKLGTFIQENQQLKIKNRNQEDQIRRLKMENNRLVEIQGKAKLLYQQKDEKWTKIRKKSIAIQQITNQTNPYNPMRKSKNILLNKHNNFDQFEDSQFSKIDQGLSQSQQQQKKYPRRNSFEGDFNSDDQNISEWQEDDGQFSSTQDLCEYVDDQRNKGYQQEYNNTSYDFKDSQVSSSQRNSRISSNRNNNRNSHNSNTNRKRATKQYQQKTNKIFNNNLTRQRAQLMYQFKPVIKQLAQKLSSKRDKIPAYSYNAQIGVIKYVNNKRLIKKKKKIRRQNVPSKPHKNRQQRLSTYSQKLIKMQQSQHHLNNNTNNTNRTNKANNTNNTNNINNNRISQPNKRNDSTYQQIIYQKNQEINKMRKQLQLSKCNIRLIEEERQTLMDQLQKRIQNQNSNDDNNNNDDNTSPNNKLNKNNINNKLEQQNQRLQKQLNKMKQLNRKLLIKMQQLSNMLMDKQEEQVSTSEQQSLQQLTKKYQEKINEENVQCVIF